ncbi:MAG: hypothetical protein MI892_26550 [Desulfobacterales bacterium]|nr:hypothetical protein [Desulfobacterales bacterium]
MKKLMVIAALLVFMTGSAWAAAEWNFYGSARVSTFYTNWDNNWLDTGSGGNPFAGTGSDTSNYEQDLNGNARIGARIKISDSLNARFEYGAKSGEANLRILWGEWNFGAGSLGIGQHYTPLLMPYSNQVYNIYAMDDGDTNMSLFGMLYGKRETMIRLKFGNFQIAAVEPRTLVHYDYAYTGTLAGLGAWVGGGGDAATYIAANTDAQAAQPGNEVKLPAIQAKYKIDFNWGHINLAGGYQTFEVTEGGDDYDVDSYVLAIGGRLNVGKAYFKGNIWGGQNVGNLADIFTSGAVFSTYANASDKVKDGAGVGLARLSDGVMFTETGGLAGTEKGLTDNDALAGLIVAGYEIRRGLYLEAGYGFTQTELDESGSTEQEATTWYIQSTIFLAEGVFITPEIGGMDTKTDDTDVMYFGAKWQINF